MKKFKMPNTTTTTQYSNSLCYTDISRLNCIKTMEYPKVQST